MRDFLAKLKDGKSAWLLAGVAGLGFCGGLLAAWLFPVDFNFGERATFAYWQEGSTTTSRSEVFRNIGLGIVAGLGLILATVRVVQLVWQTKIADKQKALTERRQINERFSRAVEHLGNEYTVVRLGGIYSLWRLIDEILEQGGSMQKKDVLMIIDTLTAFVRGYDKGRKKDAENDSGNNQAATSEVNKYGQPALRYDIETVVKLLGEEKASYRRIVPGGRGINLTRANLQRVILSGIDISGAIAVQVNISGGNLMNVNFSNADATGGNFSNSMMHGANCKNANFSMGVLVETKFNRTNLEGVNFNNADISGANFKNAKGLTQEQISMAVCETDNLPKNLPGDINAPTRTPQNIEYLFELFQNCYDSE